MFKLSKLFKLIAVVTVFVFLDSVLSGFWHAFFESAMIGWAAAYLVDWIEASDKVVSNDELS